MVAILRHHIYLLGSLISSLDHNVYVYGPNKTSEINTLFYYLECTVNIF